jgi:hypothetical protein
LLGKKPCLKWKYGQYFDYFSIHIVSLSSHLVETVHEISISGQFFGPKTARRPLLCKLLLKEQREQIPVQGPKGLSLQLKKGEKKGVLVLIEPIGL